MEPNPYETPKADAPLPMPRSVWPRVLVVGIVLIAVGGLAVVAAHVITPRRYAFVVIALTEKIVLLGLVVSVIGGCGWGISRLLASNY